MVDEDISLISRSSIQSAYTSFTDNSDCNPRYAIQKNGFLHILQQKEWHEDEPVERIQDISITKFHSTQAQLTTDGRLMFEQGHKKETYVIHDVTVCSRSVFCLTVLHEANLEKEKMYEIMCRTTDDEDGVDWVTEIEQTLRKRMESYQSEVNSCCGTLQVSECPRNGLQNTSALSPFRRGKVTCECFYYNNVLRLKNYDGPHTVSFSIKKLEVDDVTAPLEIHIDTGQRLLMLHFKDHAQYKKWMYFLQRDLLKLKAPSKMKEGPQQLNFSLLLGLTPKKMLRATARYECQTRILEVKDFAGVVDYFYVMRSIAIPPQLAKNSPYNIVLMVCTEDDIAESKPLNLYGMCSAKELERWSNTLNVSVPTIACLIDKVTVQIEFLRIMLNQDIEMSTRSKVLFREIYQLLSLKPDEMEECIRAQEEWSLDRLERLVQVALKTLVVPLVPYDLHSSFVELGRQVILKKRMDSAHQLQAFQLVEKLDVCRRDIFEKLTMHIYHITNNFVTKSKRTVTDLLRQSLAIWSRLVKNIFRFHEAESDEDICEMHMAFACHACVCFQEYLVRRLKGRLKACSTRLRNARRYCHMQ